MVRRRARLSKKARDCLTKWFNDHLEYPYPNADEKEMLQKQTGLTPRQIFHWFTNRRKRDPNWRLNKHLRLKPYHNQGSKRTIPPVIQTPQPQASVSASKPAPEKKPAPVPQQKKPTTQRSLPQRSPQRSLNSEAELLLKFIHAARMSISNNAMNSEGLSLYSDDSSHVKEPRSLREGIVFNKRNEFHSDDRRDELYRLSNSCYSAGSNTHSDEDEESQITEGNLQDDSYTINSNSSRSTPTGKDTFFSMDFATSQSTLGSNELKLIRQLSTPGQRKFEAWIN